MCCVLEPTTQMHTLATNQSLKAYDRMTVPRGQSARREDTAPEGAAEEKTAPSGASAAAMVWTVCRFVKSSIVKRTEAEI